MFPASYAPHFESFSRNVSNAFASQISGFVSLLLSLKEAYPVGLFMAGFIGTCVLSLGVMALTLHWSGRRFDKGILLKNVLKS